MAESVRDGLEILAQGEYFGRGIIAGHNVHGDPVIGYFFTGRSGPSRARKIIETERGLVRLEPTDPEEVKKGDPALLIYNVLKTVGNNIVVSNGAQTDIIASYLEANPKAGPKTALRDVFSKPHVVGKIDLTAYEPDPNDTPRISAIITRRGMAFLSVFKGPTGGMSYMLEGLEAKPGQFRMLTTYTGVNKNPLPSYTEGPISVKPTWQNPSDMAEKISQALAPKTGDDFRAGILAARFSEDTPSAGYQMTAIDKTTGELAARSVDYKVQK